MKIKSFFNSLTILCVLSLLLCSCSASKSRNLSDEEKIYGLSVVWKRAAEMYGYFELLPYLDWDGLYKLYIPKVKTAKSVVEYYNVLNQFVANLNDGHSGVSYPADTKTYFAPVGFSYVDKKYIVSLTNSESTKIPIGSIVQKINGIPAEEYIEKNIAILTGIKTEGGRQSRYASMLGFGYERASLKLEVLSPSGETVTETIKYNDTASNYDMSLRFTVDSKNEFTYKSFSAKELENNVYYVSVRNFLDINLIDEFDAFLAEIGDAADSFIIDVRGHNGGNADIGIAILSRFTDVGSLKGISARIQYKDVYKMAFASILSNNKNPLTESFEQLIEIYPDMKPMLEEGGAMLSNSYYINQRELYGGLLDSADSDIDTGNTEPLTQKVILLCDYLTSSAGEDFIAYAKDTGRFLIMGTNTLGTTGQLAMFELPGGGSFFVSVRRCLTYDGQDIINNGINPDIFIPQSYDDLINGIDSALEAAIAECKG